MAVRSDFGAVQSHCSCSYPTTPIRTLRTRFTGATTGQSLSSASSRSCSRSSQKLSLPLQLTWQGRQHQRHVCQAEKKLEYISGYTPAQFISFSDDPDHTCYHLVGTTVDAPASVCYSIWMDWARLVDFLDLIGQIGLDPNQPDCALFQCFYRWARLPVMEIVILIKRSRIEENKLIAFESVWGMPTQGEVTFTEDGSGRTNVVLRFKHQLPELLTDLKIMPFNVEQHLKKIFNENFQSFKELAEVLAKDPSKAPPKQQVQDVPIPSKAPPKQQVQDVPIQGEQEGKRDQQHPEHLAHQQQQQQQQPSETSTSGRSESTTGQPAAAEEPMPSSSEAATKTARGKSSAKAKNPAGAGARSKATPKAPESDEVQPVSAQRARTRSKRSPAR